ncbi:MAG TPA: xanthine dehydrogenase family protein molybdopterin-binding subunit [Solirubrobacteraceae bacterium]|nr:xanthine dehydrogenase family protein molybdopterin-binding subunit [Solirubrobacteraceae bacterium]
MSADGRWVGRSIPAVEHRRHLTGDGAFVDDLQRPHLRHLAFVRSPHPAARIAAVDAEAARAVPGVEAVLVAGDLGDVAPLIPALARDDFVPVEMPLLARDRVRHAGEPVAMVVATSPHAAEDGAERVRVDYEEEPAVASLEAAIAGDAPCVHDDAPGNLLLDVQFADDDVGPDFDRAAAVVEATIRTGRVTAAPMEGRACLAEWDRREDRALLYTSTQVPHIVRTAVAGILELPERRLRVIAPDVGGGFGQKCVIAREEALTLIAARAVGRPVKWVEDRQENLTAGYQGHDQRYEVRAAFDADGRILALDADILCDVGAYSNHPFTCGVEPLMAATEMFAAYRGGRYRARARAVATHKPPMAPYRGVSRPQIVVVLERLLQKAARALDLDPVEIRRRNLIPDDGFPHETPTGLAIDRGSYRESLDRCAAMLGYADFAERRRAARESGRLLGIGFSCFAERTGYGSQAFSQRKMTMTPGYETAWVRMDPGAGVTVAIGTSGHGQQHRTTLAQIAADALGVEPGRIEVVQGDTDATPYGWGTFASRSTVVGGGSTKRAATALGERLKRIGAHMLEAAPEDLELRNGAVVVRGSPDHAVALEDIARLAHLEVHKLPGDIEPGLDAQASFDPPGTFSNATHGAIVEIDPETGRVSVERYAVVEDCGVMINPAIVEGQVRGGVAQGIAAALYEEVLHAEDGQPQSTSFMDYLVPTAAEIPRIEIDHLETPSEFSETGAKGMGEGGTMGAPGCIATAVADAVAHLGIEIDTLPITPERLQRALRSARAPEGEAV